MKKNTYTILATTVALSFLPLICQAQPTGTPVPEPSTMIGGALMLVPFAVSAVRAMRKSRK